MQEVIGGLLGVMENTFLDRPKANIIGERAGHRLGPK
jgi:hypothetical protein